LAFYSSGSKKVINLGIR